MVGIVVDSVSDVMELTPESIRSAPDIESAIDNSCILGLGSVGERMLILLDIEKLMSERGHGVGHCQRVGLLRHQRGGPRHMSGRRRGLQISWSEQDFPSDDQYGPTHQCLFNSPVCSRSSRADPAYAAAAAPSGPLAQGREFVWTNADFARVQALIYQRAGISLHDGKHAMVYSRLSRRLRDTGHTSFHDYLGWLETTTGRSGRSLSMPSPPT